MLRQDSIVVQLDALDGVLLAAKPASRREEVRQPRDDGLHGPVDGATTGLCCHDDERSAVVGGSSRNHMKQCGPNESMYGAFVMVGNRVSPNNSIGVQPSNSDRSSSTG